MLMLMMMWMIMMVVMIGGGCTGEKQVLYAWKDLFQSLVDIC